MAEELKKARGVRRSKLGSFTRKKNHISQLLEGGANSEKLKSEYSELVAAFKRLEEAQENILILLEEDEMDAEETFMEDPAKVLAEIDIQIGTAKEGQKRLQEELQNKERDDAAATKKQRDSAVAVFRASVESFGKPSINLAQLSSEGNISVADMRLEISKRKCMQG